jgi:multifunctional beta-oxidation protein
VNTTSAAGLYGNWSGQLQLGEASTWPSKTLCQEGAKANIKVNVIAPIAKSRMTETIMPPNVLSSCRNTSAAGRLPVLGEARSLAVYAVGGGYVSRVAVVEAEGVGIAGKISRGGRRAVAQINDLSKAKPFNNAMEAAGAAEVRDDLAVLEREHEKGGRLE